MKAGRRPDSIIATAAVVAVLLVAAAGCKTSIPGTPRQIVKEAIRAQGELKSGRMEMLVEVEIGGASGGTSSSLRGEGYFEQPDKSKMTVTSNAGTVEVITIGDTEYVKAPGSGNWAQRSVSQSSNLGATPRDVTGYLKYTRDVRLVDHRGDTYHLEFKLDMERYAKTMTLPGIDASAFKGMAARMDVWVLKDSHHIEKATMRFAGDLSLVGAGRVTVKMDVEFSEFNEPVTIEAPA